MGFGTHQLVLEFSPWSVYKHCTPMQRAWPDSWTSIEIFKWLGGDFKQT